MMHHHPRSRYLAAIVLLTLVGFLVRAVGLDAQSLWRDEVDALRFATTPWGRMLDSFTRPGWNGPLYYLLLRGWIRLAGTSEYAMRFFSLLFGVLCVPLIYQLGRRLFRAWAAAISALLVTTSPYLVWYSQEVKMYTLVLALALLAIYSLRRALDGGGWRWWLTQIVATSLAFYSHVLAALLIPVQILLCLVWWPQTRRAWLGALISLACLTVPYLPLAAWQAPLVMRTRETGFYPYSLKQMGLILLNGWSTGITGWGRPWAPALTGLLAASGLISSVALQAQTTGSEEKTAKAAPLRHQLVMVIWLSVPLLSVWLISQRQPLFTDRYLIWAAPAFYLLVALTLTSFVNANHWSRWIVVPLLGIILAVNAGNLWRQATVPIKSDFRAAAAFVAAHQEPGAASQPSPPEDKSSDKIDRPITREETPRFEDLIIFQIPHVRYTFDYYFPIERYPKAEGLYTNHRTPTGDYLMDEEQAAQQMRVMTRGYDAAWLVASEVPMWDERNLVKQWLDDHAEQVIEGHFNRVDVYRYELPDT